MPMGMVGRALGGNGERQPVPLHIGMARREDESVSSLMRIGMGQFGHHVRYLSGRGEILHGSGVAMARPAQPEAGGFETEDVITGQVGEHAFSSDLAGSGSFPGIRLKTTKGEVVFHLPPGSFGALWRGIVPHLELSTAGGWWDPAGAPSSDFALAGLLCGLLGRYYGYDRSAEFLTELHAAFTEREDRMVLAEADIGPRMHLRAPLANNDVAGRDALVAELLSRRDGGLRNRDRYGTSRLPFLCAMGLLPSMLLACDAR